MSAEKVVELNLGVTPEAAASGAIVLQTEHSTVLTFNAMRKTDKPFPGGGFYREDAGTAIVRITRCTASKFGFPNDEAWRSIPRTKGLGYGIFEVENSLWKLELAQLNRFAFPDTKAWGGRHFLFLFHDSSFECLAHDLSLEVTKEPYAEIFKRISARLLSE